MKQANNVLDQLTNLIGENQKINIGIVQGIKNYIGKDT